MRYWISIIVAGVFLGLIAGLLPWGETEKLSLDELFGLPRSVLIKKIDKMQIEVVQLVAKKRYDKALATIGTLIALNHHDQFAYTQMARVVEETGRENFEALFRKRLGHMGDYMDRTLGAVYYHAGLLGPAGELTERFAKSHPDDLLAKFYKGALARRNGDDVTAERLLNEVIKTEVSYYHAYVELQGIYEKAGNTDMEDKMTGLIIKYNPATNREGACCGLPKPKKTEKG